MPEQAVPPPLCTFVTGPRDSGKTHYILECLRNIATGPSSTRGKVAVLMAEQGRIRAESLPAALPGLVLKKLFLPCQCCPELARLPAALRGVRETNPLIEQIFIEVPDIAALRFIEEFDQTIGWPRTMVTCVSAAWNKARRLDMLLPFQAVLMEKSDVLIEPAETQSGERDEHSLTASPFNLTL